MARLQQGKAYDPNDFNTYDDVSLSLFSIIGLVIWNKPGEIRRKLPKVESIPPQQVLLHVGAEQQWWNKNRTVFSAGNNRGWGGPRQ